MSVQRASRPRASSKPPLPSGRIEFEHAYYVKLGREGRWEKSSIQDGLVRVGWREVPLRDIVAGDWRAVRARIEKGTSDKGAATRDLHALQRIKNSTPKDVWITFYEGHLWWCRLREGAMQEDADSRFRRTEAGWSNKDLAGRSLHFSRVPGGLIKTQGFRGTVCAVADGKRLERLINGEVSSEWLAVSQARSGLEENIGAAIRLLHWRDFEVLVDLVFRQLGCRRVGELGRMQRQIDLDLQEPISGDRYQVQIKAKAGKAELAECAEAFAPGSYRRFYLVVHTPDSSLDEVEEEDEAAVHVIGPRQLATMVVDAGLITWVMDKTR